MGSLIQLRNIIQTYCTIYIFCISRQNIQIRLERQLYISVFLLSLVAMEQQKSVSWCKTKSISMWLLCLTLFYYWQSHLDKQHDLCRTRPGKPAAVPSSLTWDVLGTDYRCPDIYKDFKRGGTNSDQSQMLIPHELLSPID